MEPGIRDGGRTCRIWLRIFGWGDVCLSPIAIMVLGFYLYQVRTHIKLWQEPSNGTIEWFLSKTHKYKAILQHTGNLETAKSRASQLFGIHSDIKERCGSPTNDKTTAAMSYVVKPFIINIVAHTMNFIVGVYILYVTRNDSDGSVDSMRMLFVGIIVLLILESISCHLLLGTSEDRLCPVLKVCSYARMQQLIFVLLYRIPHLIVLYKHTRNVALVEMERERRDRKRRKTLKANLADRAQDFYPKYESKSGTSIDGQKSSAVSTLHDKRASEVLEDSLPSSYEGPENLLDMIKRKSKSLDDSNLSNESSMPKLAPKTNELDLAVKLGKTPGSRSGEDGNVADDEYESYHAMPLSSGGRFTSSNTSKRNSANWPDSSWKDNTTSERTPSPVFTAPAIIVSEVDSSVDIHIHEEAVNERQEEGRSESSLPVSSTAPDSSKKAEEDEYAPIISSPAGRVPQTQPQKQSNKVLAQMAFPNSEVSLFQRTAVIAPGKATARFSIFRPKTRRVVENGGPLPTIKENSPLIRRMSRNAATMQHSIHPVTARAASKSTDNEREFTTTAEYKRRPSKPKQK